MAMRLCLFLAIGLVASAQAAVQDDLQKAAGAEGPAREKAIGEF